MEMTYTSSSAGMTTSLWPPSPFDFLNSQWGEESAARKIQQRLAGSFCNEMTQDCGCAAAVAPFFSRRCHAGALQYVAIPVNAAFHGNLAVSWIVVRQILVPLHAHGHRKCVGNADATPPVVLGQVGISGKRIQDGCAQFGNPVVLKRNTVQQPHNAFAN